MGETEVKDVHSLQRFTSAHSAESESLLFILCLRRNFELSKQNVAIICSVLIGLDFFFFFVFWREGGGGGGGRGWRGSVKFS